METLELESRGRRGSSDSCFRSVDIPIEVRLNHIHKEMTMNHIQVEVKLGHSRMEMKLGHSHMEMKLIHILAAPEANPIPIEVDHLNPFQIEVEKVSSIGEQPLPQC
jgi:hypothetical protein